MAEQYISIKEIQDRVARHPLMQGVTLDSIVDYTVDFMRIMGIPNIFVNKVETLETHDHRIKLPCDYIETLQLRGRCGVYHYATDTFHYADRHEKDYAPCGCEDEKKNKSCGCRKGKPKERRFGDLCNDCEYCDTCDNLGYDFNQTECISILHSLKVRPQRPHSNTYMTQDSVIFLSNRHDVVELSYLAVLTDKEGYPMVPDNAKFVRALVAYIKKEYFGVLYDTGQINDKVMSKAELDYSWAVGGASTSMHELDLPRLENLSNAMHGIINRNFEFDRQFVTNSDPVVKVIH